MSKVHNVPAQLVGIIDTIFPTQKFGDMFKRVFWLTEVKTEARRYPMTWALELWHDDAHDMLMHKAGDAVRVTVEVRGHRWKPRGSNEEKIINTLRCYKIEKIQPAEAI